MASSNNVKSGYRQLQIGTVQSSMAQPEDTACEYVVSLDRYLLLKRHVLGQIVDAKRS
jgi:hypothetical protein